MLCAGLGALLERHAIDVVGCATEADEAAEISCSLKPDVLVIGTTLLRKSGLEVLTRVKRCSPATAILVFSDCRTGEYVLLSMRAGALGYVWDSCSTEDLVSSILSVRAGEEVFARIPTMEALHVLARGSAEATADVEQLTARELEVLGFVSKGMSNRDIASHLGISDRTVQSHLINIYAKLRATSRTQAVVIAAKRGLILLDA